MKKIRLLLVDDHVMVREGLRSLLKDKDDTEFKIVGEAADGEKAINLVAKLHPDVVLLDIKMPGLNGVEVCRRIGTQFPDIAVVALTTYMDERLVQECIEAGARGYLLKDADRLQLRQALRTIASGESVIDPKAVSHVVHKLREGTAEHEGSKSKDALTHQQLTILRLISQGFSNKEIGAQMTLSENTVKSYIQDLLQKMGVRNRVEASVVASKKGWI